MSSNTETSLCNSAGVMPETSPGKLVIVSGPSGAGKSTLLQRVFRDSTLPLVSSVSATTRKPRPGEIDGIHYHFLTPEEFSRHRERGEFLECFEVYGRGDWYGTLRSEVAPSLERGKWVVLEIDVQGAQAVLDQYPDAITIFVSPADCDELERRLRDRGTESEAALTRRLEVARRELAFMDRYQYRVTNQDLDQAVAAFCDILEQNCS
jgi:guanylate kinase